MNGIRNSLRAAAFPEKGNMLGLPPNSKKRIRRERRDGGGMFPRIVETVVAHFEHVTGVRPLFLFLLVFVQSSTGFYEF